jgi:hypothetical protein
VRGGERMQQWERHLADHVGIQLHRRVEWDDIAGCPDFLQCFCGPDRDINHGWIQVQRLFRIEHVLELVSPDRSVAVSSPTTDTYRSRIWVRIRTSRGSRLHPGSGHFQLEPDVNRLVGPPELYKLRERAGDLERDEALTGPPFALATPWVFPASRREPTTRSLRRLTVCNVDILTV